MAAALAAATTVSSALSPGIGGPMATGRETGSGGIFFGETLCAYLEKTQPKGRGPWAMVNRELVDKILEDEALPDRLASWSPEDHLSGVSFVIEELLGLHRATWRPMQEVTETILRLAEMGNCILVGRGAHVEYAECYRRAVPKTDTAPLLERWRRGCIDAVCITSAQGLDNLLALLGHGGAALLRATPVFVPHPRVADAARRVGVLQVGPRFFQQHLAGGHPASGVDGQVVAPGRTGVVVGRV